MNTTRRVIAGAAVVGASLVGGAFGASLVSGSASAQTDSSSSSAPADPADGADSPAAPDQGAPRGPHMANGITEEELTGDDAASVTAAAQAAVPDGTVDRVETDAEGAAFEAHMTKSDGSHVTVKLNSDFSVASIEDGMK